MQVDLIAIQPGDIDRGLLIEYAARACHNSPMGKPENRLKFLQGLADAGHLSVFEHARFITNDHGDTHYAVDDEATYEQRYLHSYNARHLLEAGADLRSVINAGYSIPYNTLTAAEKLAHATATFDISEISRACSMQIVRHRLASYSQESQRHVAPDLALTIIPPSIAESEAAYYIFNDTLAVIQGALDELHHLGIPLEDARYLCPEGAPTRLVVTRRFKWWLDFLRLREAEGAQWEIRNVAREIRAALHGIEPEVF